MAKLVCLSPDRRTSPNGFSWCATPKGYGSTAPGCQRGKIYTFWRTLKTSPGCPFTPLNQGQAHPGDCPCQLPRSQSMASRRYATPTPVDLFSFRRGTHRRTRLQQSVPGGRYQRESRHHVVHFGQKTRIAIYPGRTGTIDDRDYSNDRFSGCHQ